MDDQLVVKANALNESRYKLTVQEQRLILHMVSMIAPGDVEFKPYSFAVKDFAALVGLSGKSIYKDVKDMTGNLLGRRITIAEDDGDLQIGWISSAKYYDGQGLVELRFDPLLKPYLLALKKEFTRYQLKNTIRLKSAYSVRLYELLKQYQSVGARFFEVDELRAILGVPEGKMPLFGNFKARVLEKARRELKETDIGFTYEPLKTGRKITGLEFTIFQNHKAVKSSYKKKQDKPKGEAHKIVETQLELDFEREKVRQDLQRLDRLLDLHPDKYEILEKHAQKRLSKSEKRNRG